jgi:hypothetical protein
MRRDTSTDRGVLTDSKYIFTITEATIYPLRGDTGPCQNRTPSNRQFLMFKFVCISVERTSFISQKFVALCHYLSPRNHANNEDSVTYIRLHTLYDRRHNLNVVFPITVHVCIKHFLSLLEIRGFGVLDRTFRDFSLFRVTCNNCRSARWVSAANIVYRYTDMSTYWENQLHILR